MHVAIVLASSLLLQAPGAPAPEAPPASAQTEESPAAETGGQPERYLRIVEEGSVLRLDVAARAFRRPEGQETVWLVGAAHIASPEFYDEIQAFLDGADTVLFEGVRPEGWEPEPVGPEWRRRATYTRMRALARRLTGYRDARGRWPDTLAELDAEGPLPIPSARLDGWGRELDWHPLDPQDGPPLEIVSAGADHAFGTPDDLRLSDRPALLPVDSGHGEGLQSKMAAALGLVFQLDAIDDGGPHWRNADMSAEELSERLEAAGLDPDDLLGLLDGSSLLARVAGRVLDWVGATDTGSGLLRLVGIELLGRADELLEAAPGDLARMMDVVLEERNQVVVAAVRAAAQEVQGGSIAIFYGAGHLRPLESSLTSELGYAPVETRWLTAIRLDTAALGIGAGQVKMIRAMIARQLDLQLEIGRARQRAESPAGAEESPPGDG